MQSLRGIFPKPQAPPKRDFIKENVKNLKLMQQRKQSANQSNDIKIDENKRLQFRKSRSSSHTRIAKTRTTANPVKSIISSKSVENVSDVNYARKARPLSVQSRDACSQTEMVDDELFLKDVIIRLPSASILNNTNKPEMNCDDAEQGLNHESNGHRECRFVSVEINETDNDINRDHEESYNRSPSWKMQTERVHLLSSIPDQMIETDVGRPTHQFSSRCEHSLALCAKDTNKPNIPTSYRVGELPKYLKEMKIKEAEKSRLESMIDMNCPPGHIALSEDDRLESLNIAKKKYQDLIDDLNRLPITSHTLRVRNRQMEIEKELRQLDDTITIFSRSRVYVRVD